jgi:hypothetical protein
MGVKYDPILGKLRERDSIDGAVASSDLSDAGAAFPAFAQAETAGEQAAIIGVPTIPTIVIDDNAIEFFGYPTTLANNQFHNTGVTAVQIGNSVTSIGSYAFSTNALTSVIIPNSVTSIGSYAFATNALTSVTIPNSVTSIGSGAFSYNALTSVTIPNSVTSIGSGAFATNALTSVTIPNSVTSIGSYAFSYNPNLATVNCYVTKTIIDAALNIFENTSAALVIHARASDATWTVGTGLTIGGNTSVDVVKDLV